MMTTTKKNWPLVFALTMLFLLILPMVVAMLFPHRNVRFQIGELDFLPMALADSTIIVGTSTVQSNWMWGQEAATNKSADSFINWGVATSQNLNGWKKFDLSSISATATVDSVIWKMFRNASLSGGGGNQPCTLFAIQNDRNTVEGQQTYTNYITGTPWTAGGGDFDTNMGTFTTNCEWGANCWFRFKFPVSGGTSIFQKWVAGTRNNYGFVVVNRGMTTGLNQVFLDEDANQRDTLKVYWTPVAGGITGAKSKTKVK